MYIVITDFTDLEDKNHIYRSGDIYPFENKKIEPERIESLSGKNNKRKTKLIKECKIEDLSEKQLLEYANIMNIDLKNVLIQKIEETLKSSNIQEPPKEN